MEYQGKEWARYSSEKARQYAAENREKLNTCHLGHVRGTVTGPGCACCTWAGGGAERGPCCRSWLGWGSGAAAGVPFRRCLGWDCGAAGARPSAAALVRQRFGAAFPPPVPQSAAATSMGATLPDCHLQARKAAPINRGARESTQKLGLKGNERDRAFSCRPTCRLEPDAGRMVQQRRRGSRWGGAGCAEEGGHGHGCGPQRALRDSDHGGISADMKS
jgi:hypothetical protein